MLLFSWELLDPINSIYFPVNMYFAMANDDDDDDDDGGGGDDDDEKT